MIQYFTSTGSNSISGKDIMKLEDDFERDNYNEQPKPLPLDVKSGDAYLVRSLSNNNYIPIRNKSNKIFHQIKKIILDYLLFRWFSTPWLMIFMRLFHSLWRMFVWYQTFVLRIQTKIAQRNSSNIR